MTIMRMQESMRVPEAVDEGLTILSCGDDSGLDERVDEFGEVADIDF